MLHSDAVILRHVASMTHIIWLWDPLIAFFPNRDFKWRPAIHKAKLCQCGDLYHQYQPGKPSWNSIFKLHAIAGENATWKVKQGQFHKLKQHLNLSETKQLWITEWWLTDPCSSFLALMQLVFIQPTCKNLGGKKTPNVAGKLLCPS